MSLIEKYRLAVEISPLPMLLVLANGEIALANAAFCDLFEYQQAELIGSCVETLVPIQSRNRHPELRQAYAKVPVKRSMGAGRELHGTTKRGENIPLELGLEPVVEGVESGALVVAIDIRQRKLHEERMNLAMDAAASAMVMVDERGTIVFVNQAALKLFGYEQDALLGQRIETLVPEEFRCAHAVYLSSFVNDSRARGMGQAPDLYARHRNGNRIPVEIALTPVETNSGKLVMSTIVDLSERIEAQIRLKRKNAELAALNIELSQFAYSASHDLKAPLSSISGLLSLCIEDWEQNETGEILENLKAAYEISSRSANKVEAVLQLARVGGDRGAIESIDLRSMIDDIWLDLGGWTSNVDLAIDLEQSKTVRSERSALGVILENLLSNALRYKDKSKENNIIKVLAADEGNRFRLTIADNGIGIAQEDQKTVFRMFQRLHTHSGDGLGLALVKKHVERLGGEIALNSTIGEGSEFSFALPQGRSSE